MHTGRFFVIDGNDGSGKATQAKILEEYLKKQNKKVLSISFPRYKETFFGKLLRRALDGECGNFFDTDPRIASVLYAGDRFLSRSLIQSASNSGHYIVSDRYVSANQIHQGGKIQDEIQRIEFLSWLDEMEYAIFRIPKPDVSIYLDVPLEISLRLMQEKERDTVENNERYLRNSHEAARWLITQRPTDWICIHCATTDGTLRSREDIHREIVDKLKSRRDI